MTKDPVRLPLADGSGAMFDRIAPRYDLLNRLTSLGLDRGWRRQLIDRVLRHVHSARAPVLDVACGTADVGLALLRARSDLSVVGLDPSQNMLAEGERKWRARRGQQDAEQLRLEVGTAEAMPYRDRTFAAATMAFGIRNVPNRAAALSELRRVVEPGGLVAILELTEPRGGPMAVLARFWVHRVVPLIGAMLSGAPAYRYLSRSIEAFPTALGFAGELSRAGLVSIEVRVLGFGAAHLFLAQVAKSSATAASTAPASNALSR